MIPYLTIGERAELFGCSYLEQRDLEQREPWVKSWAARFGAGADNLRAWHAAGRPAADRSAAVVVGDPSIVAVVRAVVAKLPEAVAHFLVTNVVTKCGSSAVDPPPRASGWCRPSPAGSTKPLEVGLLVADEPIACHEFSHAYHADPSSPVMAGLTAEQRARLRAAVRSMIVEDGSGEIEVEKHLQRERAADSLASQLIGYRVDTTSGACGALRRAGLRRDLLTTGDP